MTERPAASPVGAIVALAGTVGLLIGLFLPYLEAVPGTSGVVKNSYIQSGPNSIEIIVAAVIIAGSAIRMLLARKANWGSVIGGLVAGGFLLYMALSPQFRMLYFGSDTGTGTKASLGIGPWLMGVGAALGVAGGVIARFPTAFWGVGVTTPKKACPDCAESVQAEARVCKHCGHRFSEEAPVSV